jgi:hypothetical protein
MVCKRGDNFCPLACNDWKLDADCGGVPKVWNMVASDDPKDYMGDIIATEATSDWVHYAPLTNKVGELMQGAATDREKAQKIADWVMNSKPYDHSGNANMAAKGGSVIDIFNEPEGVCLDAGILLAAMLRVANISARAVSPAFGPHEYTEAYLDGKWVAIDSTFNTEPTAYMWDENSQDPFSTITYGWQQFATGENYKDESHIFSRVHYFKTVITQKNVPAPYGYVEFPVSARQLFYSPTQNLKISLNYSKETYVPMSWSCGLIQKEWNCDVYSCSNRPVENGKFVGMAMPGITVNGVDQDGVYKGASYPVNGYLRVAFPSGKWRLDCTLAGTEIAYQDITIVQGTTLRIHPDDLTKYPEASVEMFNVVVDSLKKSTEGL